MSARNIRSAVGNFYLLVVFGFRFAIEDGTRKERDCRSSLLEQDSISLFYCNSRKAILNSHQPQEKRSFSESFWCRFFQKGAVLAFCVAEKSGVVRCYLAIRNICLKLIVMWLNWSRISVAKEPYSFRCMGSIWSEVVTSILFTVICWSPSCMFRLSMVCTV